MDNRLSENIKEARIDRGFRSQQAFADFLGVHFKTVQYWENGKTIPDLESLILIADKLDVDLDYLTGRIDKPTHDLQYISEKTGLSVEAIRTLNHLTGINPETPAILSRMICHRLFVQLIRTISILSRPKSFFNKQFSDYVPNYLVKRLDGEDVPYLDDPEDVRAIYETQVVRIAGRIVDDITDQKKRPRKNP